MRLLVLMLFESRQAQACQSLFLSSNHGFPHERDRARKGLPSLLTNNNAAAAQRPANQRLIGRVQLKHGVYLVVMLQFHGSGVDVHEQIERHS